MYWAGAVLDSLVAAISAVVVDSAAYSIPDGVYGYVLADLGYCGTKLIPDSLIGPCTFNALTNTDVPNALMRQYPKTTFVYLQSKYDTAQMFVYNTFAVSLTATGLANLTALANPTEYYEVSLPILTR